MTLPAWFAVIVHVPAEAMVTVKPATVQTACVEEERLTTSPELAVAVTVKGATPKVTLAGAKLIVWGVIMFRPSRTSRLLLL